MPPTRAWTWGAGAHCLTEAPVHRVLGRGRLAVTAGGAGRDRPAESSTSSFAGFPAEAFEFYEQLLRPTRPSPGGRRTRRSICERSASRSQGSAPPSPTSSVRPSSSGRIGTCASSKDKTPYKDHQGMYVEACGGDAAEASGLGWYVQVSAGGLMVAGGWYQSSPDQVARYRAALATAAPAERLAGLVQALTDEGLTLGGDRLKSRPAVCPPTTPMSSGCGSARCTSSVVGNPRPGWARLMRRTRSGVSGGPCAR